jgi:uncharacterized OB-fold protein
MSDENAGVVVIAPGLFDESAPLEPGVEIRLTPSWCQACDRYEFPQRRTCPQCGAQSPPKRLGARAIISQYTDVNYPVPGGKIPTPYAVAVADFEEGISILGVMPGVAARDLEVGQAVRTVALEVGDKISFGYEPLR